MAAYRKISVTFWNDSFVQGLTPEGKYFYLFLMTNTRTTQCGIYEITMSQMCFETGYNQATVEKLLLFFEKSDKIKYSKSTNEIALRNWPKYNDSESPKVLSCVEKELKQVKNKVLIQYLYSMDTQSQETKEETKAKEEEETKPRFADFWDKYDKKIDRPKAEKSWKKIKQKEREKIMIHLDHYIQSTPDKKYRKNAGTYLNQKGWENEIIGTPKKSTEQFLNEALK
jgi:predicted Fe-S protein YdhL (DUF1289 family)